ncbi:hypothetical protein PLICRDRAFT_36908 [Plicaturopsis crispa FD-325 SS-3]|nr:hypothetical protein PLICRDRAFT_36908 [Plicaturopsis crispa FD-325 SS-3]
MSQAERRAFNKARKLAAEAEEAERLMSVQGPRPSRNKTAPVWQNPAVATPAPLRRPKRPSEGTEDIASSTSAKPAKQPRTLTEPEGGSTQSSSTGGKPSKSSGKKGKAPNAFLPPPILEQDSDQDRDRAKTSETKHRKAPRVQYEDSEDDSDPPNNGQPAPTQEIAHSGPHDPEDEEQDVPEDSGSNKGYIPSWRDSQRESAHHEPQFDAPRPPQRGRMSRSPSPGAGDDGHAALNDGTNANSEEGPSGYDGMDEHDGGMDEHDGGMDEHNDGTDEHNDGMDLDDNDNGDEDTRGNNRGQSSKRRRSGKSGAKHQERRNTERPTWQSDEDEAQDQDQARDVSHPRNRSRSVERDPTAKKQAQRRSSSSAPAAKRPIHHRSSSSAPAAKRPTHHHSSSSTTVAKRPTHHRSSSSTTVAKKPTQRRSSSSADNDSDANDESSEESWPGAPDIVFPSKPGNLCLGQQHPKIRELIRAAMPILNSSALLVNPFAPRKDLQLLSLEAIIKATRSLSMDDVRDRVRQDATYRRYIIQIPYNRFSNYRSSVKAAIRSAVLGSYGLTDRTKKLARALINGQSFIYPGDILAGKSDTARGYYHPAVTAALVAFFATKTETVDLVREKLQQPGDTTTGAKQLLPPELLAFIATAMCCCIEERGNGPHQDISFDHDRYKNTYDTHLRIIDRVRVKNSQAHRALLSRLYKLTVASSSSVDYADDDAVNLMDVDHMPINSDEE